MYDLNRDGIKLVVANSRVPVGSYTRTVLRNLGLTSALRNVVSQEADVTRRAGQGGPRAGRRGLRVRHGRAGRGVAPDDGPDPGASRSRRCATRSPWSRAATRRPRGRSWRGRPARWVAGCWPRPGSASRRRRSPRSGADVMGRVRPFTVILVLAAVAALAFLVIPMIALFTESPPGQTLDHLDDPVVRDALIVTLKTNLIAFADDAPGGHAGRLPDRAPALPRPDAGDHARGAAAGAPARRRGHRPAGRLRPVRPARGSR